MAYSIIFDGGNNKNGAYGSYIIFNGGSIVAISIRQDYPNAETGNQAEYTSLLDGLVRLRRIAPEGATVRMYGDSKLVVNQVAGKWAAKNPRLVELRDQCRGLLAGYNWDINWWPRENSVRYFNH